MHPAFFPSVAAAALLVTLGPPAAAAPESTPIAVVFEASAADLPQSDIRSAIGKELARPVRSEPGPSIGQLRIARNPKGELVVRYMAPEDELERTLAVPADKNQLPPLLGLVAQNLVSGEPRELMAELDRKRRAVAPAGPMPAVASVPAPSSDRSGVHIRLSLSAGYGAGIYSYEGNSAPGFGVSQTLTFGVALTGPSSGLDVAVGYMISSGVALGVEGSVTVEGPLQMHGSLGQTNINVALPLTFGGYVDYYTDQRGPLHFQAGVGITRSNFASQTIEIASFDNVVVVRPVSGASGYVGVGYDFGGAGGFGLFSRVHAAYLTETSSTYAPFDLRIGASVSWF